MITPVGWRECQTTLFYSISLLASLLTEPKKVYFYRSSLAVATYRVGHNMQIEKTMKFRNFFSKHRYNVLSYHSCFPTTLSVLSAPIW